MKRVACLTPLPPVKSGIASYAVMLFREWQKQCDLTAVVAQDSVSDSSGVAVLQFDDFLKRRGEFDSVYCQIGNNPHHEVFYRYALEHPSVVVLHDLVLHHLIVEMTLARGDVEGYVAALRRNHGEAGAAWARGRSAGLHDEIGNFLFPASIDLAQRSLHVIVHNDYAREVLLRHGVTTPITVTGHPLPAVNALSDRKPLRASLGFDDQDVVIAMFGFVTAAKRPEVVLRAFAAAAQKRANVRLLIVGEPAPNIDLQRLAAQAGIPESQWKATGYVADDDFVRYLDAVDRVVNLRYPSAGETSGALIHVIAAGRPIAVSDYGPFADLPPEVASKIPLGGGEHDALVEFMLEEESMSVAQREWVARTCDTAVIAGDYMNAAAALAKSEVDFSIAAALPLFPQWELESWQTTGGEATVRLLNRGGSTLKNPLYGEPAYRVVAKFATTDHLITDQWLRPAGDVRADESVTLSFPIPRGARRVTLAHAIEGIESVESEPFATLELGDAAL